MFPGRLAWFRCGQTKLVLSGETIAASSLLLGPSGKCKYAQQLFYWPLRIGTERLFLKFGEIMGCKSLALKYWGAFSMKSIIRLCSITCIAIGLEISLAGDSAVQKPAMPANSKAFAQDYEPTKMCKGCHDLIVAQHLTSSHEMSFTNPAFQAQYQKDLLPKAENDPALYREASECISCHEPITYAKKGPQVVSMKDIHPDMNGVTCDVCHTMTGWSGPNPENGNYIMAPSEKKFGPFKGEGDWHHIYSELQTTSEICAVCHEAVNRMGFRIKATFTEWKESVFAKQDVHCQDCHMNVDGFLTAGKPRFASGKAANMSLGSAPQRERLYTHEFPGAHSKTQVEGAIELSIEATPVNASQSRIMAIDVTVDNSRTGHSMPSGSADLRLLWLEVTARVGDQILTVPAAGMGSQAADELNLYSRVGYGKFDAQLVGPEIPKGSRVYRAIFVDAKGQATLNSYDAVATLFDNRLKAAEKRKESHILTIPEGVKGDISIEATLRYLPYSSTFTDHLALPKPEAVIVARREIKIEAQGR